MATKVIFIAGPTASGKSSLAMELCQRLPCEIVSVDSATVYRDMNIGTAKPDATMLAQATHHLIDICDPTDSYSAGRFCKDAISAIEKINEHNNIALLVGGTGLYFKALQHGLSILPGGNSEIRAQISQDAKKHGWPAMHQKLKDRDPQSAAKIHINDAQRISRALEILQQSGTGQQQWFKDNPPSPAITPMAAVVIAPAQRETLHQRIEQRFTKMLDQGMVEELQGLRKKYSLHKEMPAMRLVGYRQVWQYLDGELEHAQMQQKAISATRQLARRQLTWFRSWTDATWLDPQQGDCIDKLCQMASSAANKQQ